MTEPNRREVGLACESDYKALETEGRAAST
jgi:hypothetical protein